MSTEATQAGKKKMDFLVSFVVCFRRLFPLTLLASNPLSCRRSLLFSPVRLLTCLMIQLVRRLRLNNLSAALRAKIRGNLFLKTKGFHKQL